MIKNNLELAYKVLKSDASEDARILAATYIPVPFHLRDAISGLEYGAECTLATVNDLVTKTKTPVYETYRQISIAQTLIATLNPLTTSYDYECKSRVKEVIVDFEGNVNSWALNEHLKYHANPNVDKLKAQLSKL